MVGTGGNEGGFGSIDDLLRKYDFALQKASLQSFKRTFYLEQAVSLCAEGLHEHPDSRELLVRMMDPLYELNRFDEVAARCHYLLASGSYSDNAVMAAEIANYWGDAMLLLDKPQSARAHFLHAHDLLVTDVSRQDYSIAIAQITSNIGRTYLEEHKSKAALAHFNRALKTLPDDHKILRYRASALLHESRYGEAHADLERARGVLDTASAKPADYQYQLTMINYHIGMAYQSQAFEDRDTLTPSEFIERLTLADRHFQISLHASNHVAGKQRDRFYQAVVENARGDIESLEDLQRNITREEK